MKWKTPESVSLACCLSLLWGAASAVLLKPALPPPLMATLSAGPVGGNATFDQLIDHSNPGLGTFKQRYWWNTTHWAGPGSPVCLPESLPLEKGVADDSLGCVVHTRGVRCLAIYGISDQPDNGWAVRAEDRGSHDPA
ncbi:hypothetical protein QBC47DRAFT_377547 [Echria macrotheca]|uniref:Uncharacterized protein n=1 Tax=Echria macrotheca TaxID=438768 RepID=A0AAJ0F6E0_9PEZI|nr:hypothetical protein QBC47DRAFT_377547 [Echria macrotheca]